jgi:hypothetical protein
MAFCFVLFLDSHLFLRMSHCIFHVHLTCLHPFVLVPSLSLLRALPFTKKLHFACRSELLLLTTSLMGAIAAAAAFCLRTALARGCDVGDGIPCVGICLVCPH